MLATWCYNPHLSSVEIGKRFSLALLSKYNGHSCRLSMQLAEGDRSRHRGRSLRLMIDAWSIWAGPFIYPSLMHVCMALTYRKGSWSTVGPQWHFAAGIMQTWQASIFTTPPTPQLALAWRHMHEFESYPCCVEIEPTHLLGFETFLRRISTS